MPLRSQLHPKFKLKGLGEPGEGQPLPLAKENRLKSTTSAAKEPISASKPTREKQLNDVITCLKQVTSPSLNKSPIQSQSLPPAQPDTPIQPQTHVQSQEEEVSHTQLNMSTGGFTLSPFNHFKSTNHSGADTIPSHRGGESNTGGRVWIKQSWILTCL